MRLLLTGDWQLDFQNLATAERMVNEILALCTTRNLDAVVNLGDIKDAYNPVDVRVVNFIVWVCTEFRTVGVPFYVLMGNHDRVGMYADNQNWLPVLQEAGASVYDKPTVVELDDSGVLLHFLPFITDKEKLREEARGLSKQADPLLSVLLFHEELEGVRYNLSSKSETAIVKMKDLRPEKYMFCVGGHMHLQQKMGENIWYAGSPFCMDWGEVNQRKGYLLLDTEKKKVFSIRSSLPGLYDPLYPGFDKNKPESWEGDELRIHVPYDRSLVDLQAVLNKAKKNAEIKYPGAQIIVSPEYVSDKDVEAVLDAEASDEEHVREYVRQTLPSNLRENEERVIKYLTKRLTEVGIAARQRTSVRFLRSRAFNFLSFKKLELDYTKKGITVVVGKNDDWRGKSNGAGKTTVLQAPVVAMFGQTFKGQKHDKWARRGSIKKAFVALELTNGSDRKYKIIRTRRPHRIQFKEWTGDKWLDISTGNTKKSTEKLIEETLGFTIETLANSIYIDQARTNALLTGTDMERKKLLERFQNLERYTLAQNLVKDDRKALDKEIIEVEAELLSVKNLISELGTMREGIDLSDYRKARIQFDKLQIKVRTKSLELGEENTAKKKEIGRLDGERRETQTEFDELYYRAGTVRGQRDTLQSWVKRMSSLGDKCPTCERPIKPGELEDHIEERNEEIAKLMKKHKSMYDQCDELMVKIRKINGDIKDIQKEIELNQEKIRDLDKTLLMAESEVRKLKGALDRRREIERKILDEKKRETLFKEDLDEKRRDRYFYEYCEESFSRKGLPAFLNALIVPRLNKSAEYYSKLFTDGAIQVRFESLDGDFDVRVVNVFGGQDVEDQSTGELKMASLITSFALRESTLESNMLILDEPGDGLDSANAKRFAESIRKIAPRFGAVWLTSHNSVIQAELSGERILTVVKQGGISRIV